MADPNHHAISSARKWGGTPEDYIHIHVWFDSSKHSMCDFRHRAMYHHAEGIALCLQLHGRELVLSSGKKIPTRWVAEQHVLEDLGHIPNMADWFRCIQPVSWMGRVPALPKEVTGE